MDVSVELHCDKCGSANLSLPGAEESATPIVCNDCGQGHGTIGELAESLMSCARAQSAETLREAASRIPPT